MTVEQEKTVWLEFVTEGMKVVGRVVDYWLDGRALFDAAQADQPPKAEPQTPETAPCGCRDQRADDEEGYLSRDDERQLRLRRRIRALELRLESAVEDAQGIVTWAIGGACGYLLVKRLRQWNS